MGGSAEIGGATTAGVTTGRVSACGVTIGGATDGGMIHLHNEGVPTVVIGVPTRHIHSHNAILCRDDYDQALQLVVALVKKLDAATVAGLTA